MLAAEAEQFLDRIDEDDPEGARLDAVELPPAGSVERGRAAVPRPPDRDRLRPRTRAGAHRAARGGGRRGRSRRRRSTRARAASRGCTRRVRRCGRWSRNGVAAVEGGPAAVPAVRLPDGSRRAHLPTLELTAVAAPCRRAAGRRPGRRRRRGGASAARRRRRRARAHAVVVERDVPRLHRATATTSCSRSTSRSAASVRCGTSRAARCASARSPRSRCPTRSAGSIVPDTVLARRPARHRDDAAVRRARSGGALLHVARRPRRRVPAHGRVRRRDQQHRSQGRSLPARRPTVGSSASTTACRSTRSGSSAR